MLENENWSQIVFNTFTNMGLDNGIVLKTKIKHDIPPYFNWRDHPDECDVCYWRKFWGFRNEVVSEFNQSEECADIYLDANDIGKIRCILEQYLDRDYYDNNANSVWEYEEYLIHNINCLKYLEMLQNFLEEHPNEKCYFYDSY